MGKVFKKSEFKQFVLEEVKKLEKKEELLEQKNKIERQLSSLNEEFSEDGATKESQEEEFEVDEVFSGEENKPEFEMKGSHLVEDDEDVNEFWTKMDEEFEKLEMEWKGEMPPSEQINDDNSYEVEDEINLGEPVPSGEINESKNIKEDLSKKTTLEEAKTIEDSLKEKEVLDESTERRKRLAGIIL